MMLAHLRAPAQDWGMLANTPNFPAQIRAAIFLHPWRTVSPAFRYQSASPASIDQKIAMFVRYAGGTNLQARHPALSISCHALPPSGLANVLPPVRTPRGCASPLLATISSSAI